MDIYNSLMYDIFLKRIQAQDEAIEKLTGYVKDLVAELKGVYEKNLNDENNSTIINFEKYATKNTVIRWEESKKPNQDLGVQSRATGVITSNGFLEFKRVIDGTVTLRSRYNSLKDWAETLPKHGKYRVMKQ